jgi:hypothetical protein
VLRQRYSWILFLPELCNVAVAIAAINSHKGKGERERTEEALVRVSLGLNLFVKVFAENWLALSSRLFPKGGPKAKGKEGTKGKLTSVHTENSSLDV